MSKKGSKYEREVCKQLSDWWSYGKDDNIFWRTQGSGARATQRSKKGLETAGHYGDICATNPIGASLTRMFTFSLKRGQCRGATIQDLLDLPPENKTRHKTREMESWIYEIDACSEISKSLTWAIIFKRDSRDAIFMAPSLWMNKLGIRSVVQLFFLGFHISVTKLDWFFEVPPKKIENLVDFYND